MVEARAMYRGWQGGSRHDQAEQAQVAPPFTGPAKGCRQQAADIALKIEKDGPEGADMQQHVEQWMENMLVVGLMLMLTGTLLFIGERYRRSGRRGEAGLTVSDALLTGIAQGLAVLPGLSRSGSTIAMLLFRGIDGETAARFSILMAMPAIAGAALLSLKDLGSLPTGEVPVYLAGTGVAFMVGLGAIRLLLKVIRRQRLLQETRRTVREGWIRK